MATAPNSLPPAPDRTIYHFASMGAIGGLCAFLLSRMAGAGPFYDRPIYLDLPTELILGGVAALFGVYMLTASDLARTQTLVFALACGVSWSPIFTAAKFYVDKHTDNAASSDAKRASAIAGQISAQAGDRAEDSKKAAATQINDALEKIPHLSTISARKEVVDSSKEVVASIASASPDSTTVEALKSIGLSSDKVGAAQVNLLTFEKLRQIAVTPTVPQSTRADASQAATVLADANPDLKKYSMPNYPTPEIQ